MNISLQNLDVSILPALPSERRFREREVVYDLCGKIICRGVRWNNEVDFWTQQELREKVSNKRSVELKDTRTVKDDDVRLTFISMQ